MNTESKIDQLQFFISVNKNIFGFDVSVNNVLSMKIPNGFRNNQQELLGFVFF